jgi:hypothetical protein
VRVEKPRQGVVTLRRALSAIVVTAAIIEWVRSRDKSDRHRSSNSVAS